MQDERDHWFGLRRDRFGMVATREQRRAASRDKKRNWFPTPDDRRNGARRRSRVTTGMIHDVSKTSDGPTKKGTAPRKVRRAPARDLPS